mmetsp:Transcript_13422/g.17008  ORF Transcript_13422/g.17008 Transcript_13422/m.17008 type:complete len:80 (+) Transcript_13422:1098-1337(+)
MDNLSEIDTMLLTAKKIDWLQKNHFAQEEAKENNDDMEAKLEKLRKLAIIFKVPRKDRFNTEEIFRKVQNIEAKHAAVR